MAEIPEEFKKMLEKSPKAKEFYYSLSYSNRRKYILWITSAKKEETKIKRMKDGINKLENSLVI